MSVELVVPSNTASRWPDDDQWVRHILGDDGGISAAWGKSPMLLKEAGLPDSIPGVAELLRTPLLRPPYVTVLVDGVVVPNTRFCHPERIINIAPTEHVVDAALLADLLASGASVKFNRMELWSPPIRGLAERFALACGKQVKVWGFLSPHAQMLVPVHRDPAHVLAVQLEGDKHWTLGGPCPAERWSVMDQLTVDEPEALVLERGDVLYMPYGYAHCAAAATASSFHISFALEGTTAGELRQRLLKAVADGVDGLDATEVREDNIAQIIDAVCHTLGDVSERAFNLASADAQAIYGGRAAGVFDKLLQGGSVT